MASCLNPVFRSAGRQGIWAAKRERAEKLNAEVVNPLLTRYIELVSIQARLSSILMETLRPPDTDNDCALLFCFSREGLQPVLALATREVKLVGQESEPSGESLDRLEDLWNQVEEFQYPRDFGAQLVLEVFATEVSVLPHRNMETTPDRCSQCGFPVLCSIAREEGMGRRRAAVCSFCSSEWPAPRLGCLSCGEQEASKLPVYSFDAWPHIRVDACDSCGGYLKSIDLTKDAEALPVPDDIASSAINIWAFERGYKNTGKHFFNL